MMVVVVLGAPLILILLLPVVVVGRSSVVSVVVVVVVPLMMTATRIRRARRIFGVRLVVVVVVVVFVVCTLDVVAFMMTMRSLTIGFETTTRTRRRFSRASPSSSVVRSLDSWSSRRHDDFTRRERADLFCSSSSSELLRFVSAR